MSLGKKLGGRQAGLPNKRSALAGELLWLSLLMILLARPACADAPFRTIKDAENAATLITRNLFASDVVAAVQLAIRDSHLDDPYTQKNLQWVQKDLPMKLNRLGKPVRFIPTGTDRFVSAFVRFNFLLHYERGALRLMLTFRRKTAGWRLNQLYFD